MNWQRHRNTTPPAGTRLGIERMEDRSLPAALSLNSLFEPIKVDRAGDAATADVYTETNNPNAGLNAVLGFHRNADGSLAQFGSFATGGTGQLNIPKAVGPDDGDQQVRVTADGKFLFAVNQGSDSVSAFRVKANGRLDLVGVFPTGGDQPDSIGIAGRRLYVANRGDAASNHPGTTAPGVTGFDIGSDGTLTPIANSTVSFPVGTLATQTLVSRDGRFLFVEVGTLAGTPGGNTVNAFQIRGDGSLVAAPGGPAGAGTNAPFLLGAAAHPRLNIVYTGFASAGQVGVFTYDETGRTTFVGTAADSGAAPCWCVVTDDGKLLYVTNTATDSVGVFSLADPLHPVQIQDLPLGGPRGATATGRPIANAFEIALDPSGKYLFAISQTTDPAFPQGNQLHTLKVARDGTLTEPKGPIVFAQKDVPANAHPQGLAAVATSTGGREGGSIGQLFGSFDFGEILSDLDRIIKNVRR
ncbi:lactonase family protein [Limnoglobus roseus]|uniref:Lactonase family protein n=1 Tax=Limnoglobus roseus TaxID=2598579 RepID=A0A5C1AIC6_9BACT|nr:beta-propeller fold lactonase family protein [Limnoglobus roseus]QEL17756.1 lactonase family protein [Limnoglobus roseus]